MEYCLNSLEETLLLGQKVAQAITDIQEQGKKLPQALYLYGDLGAGKTTFTRAFVEALPNGNEAEVGSPSFTICHEYPTNPEIFHTDLYRLADGCDIPEELQYLSENSMLCVEWPERLHEQYKHTNRLDFYFNLQKSNFIEKIGSEKLDNFDDTCDKKRLLTVKAHGEEARSLLQRINELCKEIVKN